MSVGASATRSKLLPSFPLPRPVHMATEHPKTQRHARRAMRPGKRQFEEVIDLLYRRRRIILATFLVVSVVAAASVLTRSDVYQAQAVVLIDLTKATGAEDTGAGPAGTTAFVRDNRTTETELFILGSSRGIRERVAERLKEENGGDLPPGGATFELASRNVSSAIQIVGSSSDPEAAAAWANAYAEEYVTQTQLASRSYLTSTREFLQEQADRLRGELGAAERRVAGQTAAAGSAVAGSGAILSQIASLRAQRDEAVIDLQTRQNQLASITSQLGDISPRLAERMSSNVERQITAIDQQITAAETERRTKAAYWAEPSRTSNPAGARELAQIDQRLRDLERRKATLTNQYVGEVMGAGGIAAPEAGFSYVADLQGQAAQERVAISGLRGRVSQLNARIGQLEGQARRAPGAVTAIASSERDQAHAAQMYEYVVTQLQQTQIAEESEPGYARVLREADVPTLPSGPSPFKNLLVTLLGGLGLGIALAIARDKVDNRIHKPDHVAAMGISVLEATPDLRSLIKDELDGAETIDVNGRPFVSEMVTVHAPLSPASETYRHLRTRVQFSRPGMVVRSIVVTSGGSGEGKSTTAANLAVTFAQAGRRTVLIDADLRRPRQQDVFGVSGEVGLAQVLEVKDTSPDTLRHWLDDIFDSGVPNLSVIPTGAIALEYGAQPPDDGRTVIPNPSEFLGSPDMRALLRGLLEVADVIIIDTPPVLAATDAVLLSTQADATLFVTCAGKTKAGDIEQSLAHLDDVGAEVIGAVLNRFSLEHAAGYVYTYGHYSRYGPYSKYGPYGEGGKKDKKKAKRAEARPDTPTA